MYNPKCVVFWRLGCHQSIFIYMWSCPLGCCIVAAVIQVARYISYSISGGSCIVKNKNRKKCNFFISTWGCAQFQLRTPGALIRCLRRALEDACSFKTTSWGRAVDLFPAQILTAAMRLTAAASGFVVFLLSVSGTVHLHLHLKVSSTFLLVEGLEQM